MLDIGFIKLHRQILDWEWYKDNNTKILFLHLILKANFKTKKWQGIEVKRGSFITSLQNLSFETGLTQKQVRTSLNKLKKTGEVASKTSNKYSLITITYYEKYQEKTTIRANEEASDEANEGQTKGKQRATTKECKEVKECKEIYFENEFEEFWSLYPRKLERKKSEIRFNNILKNKEATFEEIIKGLKNYIAYLEQENTEKCFIKHSLTWLNGYCWQNEYEITEEIETPF